MEPCGGSAEQVIDDRADAGAHRIDARQTELVLGLTQIIARRRSIEHRGIDADPDAAHRRVGQLGRLDIALDAQLQIGQPVAAWVV